MSVETLVLDPAKARNVFSMNGLWQIQPGVANQIPDRFDSTVHVPALVDVAEPGYDWALFGYHYYRRVFRIDTPLHPVPIFLKIGQAQFGTNVWLNGEHVGTSISCYTSQEYRVDQALRWGEEIEVVVCVGAKQTLPPESAVGKDQEKELFIPGIWGDVSLIACGSIRVKLVQVIPHIESGTAEARIMLENLTDGGLEATLIARVVERTSGKEASDPMLSQISLPPHHTHRVTLHLQINDLKLWSPEAPFLYELESLVLVDGAPVDEVRTTFGMREFSIKGRGFYLNGKRVFLKGGNIAFHRFLSDRERGLLPWDRAWIKRVLIDIPKQHHFNFFRAHLGQMYGLWYDLADEYGMLIQNEWQFWTTTGTSEQIKKEFTEWLTDNWNHPSIIIWDPLNESTDDVLQEEIVPEMKKLDPTRPWESVDFTEEHPYIYSLGPVLNKARLGFSRSLHDIEHSSVPTVLNEFIWWWLNSDAEPTALMTGVVERWLGPSYTKEALLRHQAFLAQELIELFRRMRVDAIQPFVYLSNNNGATGHWFVGPIPELKPKPILAALKNAFSPFGISVELWDRHFFTGEKRLVDVWVFNDESEPNEGVVHCGIADANGGWIWKREMPIKVGGSEAVQLPNEIVFPSTPGSYLVKAELYEQGSNVPTSVSRKIAHVFGTVHTPSHFSETPVAVLEKGEEYRSFLQSVGVPILDAASRSLSGVGAVLVVEGETSSQRYSELLEELSKYVSGGGVLILVEPEYGIQEKCVVSVLRDLDLVIEPRRDTDRGGYDSYVFAKDFWHPIWSGLHEEHLKMFNGGYGGEVVSEHNVVPTRDFQQLALCGLGLATPAVMELSYGEGKVLISRLQMRGRLSGNQTTTDLFARRVDPVLQRYMVNLLSYAFAFSTSTPTMAMKDA